MRDDSTSVRNLVIGMLLVAAPFAIAYLLTRGNPYSEILLIVAIFCAGLALMFAMASGLQQVAGVADSSAITDDDPGRTQHFPARTS